MNRSRLRISLLAPLLAVLALLLGLAGSASAAFNAAATDPHYGNFLLHTEAPARMPLAIADSSREIDVWLYDSTLGVPVYVQQNPWTAFDPEGLNAFTDVVTLAKVAILVKYQQTVSETKQLYNGLVEFGAGFNSRPNNNIGLGGYTGEAGSAKRFGEVFRDAYTIGAILSYRGKVPSGPGFEPPSMVPAGPGSIPAAPALAPTIAPMVLPIANFQSGGTKENPEGDSAKDTSKSNAADTPALKYHYTTAPESSFEQGLWRDSSVTDKLYTNPVEAGKKLGIPTPDKVIPIRDAGHFVPNKPPIVQPSNRYQGGGTDFVNPNPVPPEDILPAQPIGG